MTLDQLDTVINAYVWVDDQVGTFGPGLALAVGTWIAWSVWKAGRGLTGWIRYRRQLPAIRAAIDAETQRAAAERDRKRATQRAMQTTPHIPTRPGTNQQALHTCNAIWNTDTRKENET